MNDNTQVSNKKYRLNPKIKRRVVKVIKSAALVALLSALSVHGIYEIRENRRANNIINSYKSQGNYACLPSTIVSSENYDVNLCRGFKLANALDSNNIDFVCIDGCFYTPNGTDIAIVTVELTEKEYIMPNTISVGSSYVYMAPTGYELEGHRASKTTIKQEKYIVNRNETGDYCDTISNLLSGRNITNGVIIDVKNVQTLPYKYLDNCDLVADVPDDTLENTENEATLHLIMKQ